MPKSLFPQASPDVRAWLEQDPTVKLLNAYDWSANPLGPIPTWPESLKGAVRLMMVASTPMVMLVGERAILIYNDAYGRFAGRRHPEIFGMPALEAWPEIADFNRMNIERGLRGESYVLRDQELVLNRHGQLESGWMDLHYSPIVGEDGRSMGTLCIVHETTDRVLAEMALSRSEERLSLALTSSALVGTWDWNVADNVVTADDQFASMFNITSLRAGLGVPVVEFLRAVHPDDRKPVLAELRSAVAERREFRCECRVVAGDGTVRWIVAAGRPRHDGTGQVNRFPGVAIDVTEQHRAAEALAESEERFRTLADTMPQRVWTALPNGRVDYVNARWHEFTGVETIADGAEWGELIHPDDREAADAAWRRSLETGEVYQVEYRMRDRSGEYRWSLSRALPIRDGKGRVVRWIGTSTDIHESRRAAEERELVAQELSHRIKNIFAVLTGIISLSARSTPEAKPFADQLRQRIFALGEAHDFVRPHSHFSSAPDGQGALSALIRRLVRAYEEGAEGQRFVFEGDDIGIDDAAATPLALLFHELATNAAKYGALSHPQGRVVITATREGENYRLEWKEKGGPEVAEPPAVNGFGTRLVGLSVEGQMRGTLERHWEPDGLRVVTVVPVEALRRSTRLRDKPEEGN